MWHRHTLRQWIVVSGQWAVGSFLAGAPGTQTHQPPINHGALRRATPYLAITQAGASKYLFLEAEDVYRLQSMLVQFLKRTLIKIRRYLFYLF
jgi:hypothetical protein